MIAARYFAIAMLVALGSVASAAESPSFLNEIVPLLTKTGCNQGSCHGKGSGQNGFRLSLRGYAPDQDYRWLTREFDARRLDSADPAASLLLRKASAQTPHEGGRIFTNTSREYQLLHDWLKNGAPGPDAKTAKITALKLTPETQTMAVGGTATLKAMATFDDGTQRDVTWLTKFDSNDAAFLTVNAAGTVTSIRHGATAVRAMFLTEVSVATFVTPFPREIDNKRFAIKNNFVDEAAFAKLAELKIEPSDLCSDDEFIRRLFLDACGCLPKPAEVTAFVADLSPKKREKLIEDVLARPEFTDYWTLQLSDLLQNRRERDHDVRGVKGVRQFHDWIRHQVMANRPWDALARDVLTAKGNINANPAVGYFLVTVGEHRHGEQSEVGESVAQAFLGTRIGCAKCHNHPLERYTQDDFYHFAAFFSRVKLDRKDSKSGATQLRVSHPDDNENKRPIGVNQPRTNVFLKPQPLDRTKPAIAVTEDPRQHLAEWIANPSNEFFAGAMVNRVWRHYLGVGLVEPVDDLRATNPPTVPALWKALKAEFVAKKFDLRHLMRVILNSRTYQLSSSTRATNETDTRFYSHYYARRLPAEVLLDALSDATNVSEVFDGYPRGVRAVQVPDPGTQSYFLRLFGRSERVTACACERTGDVTMPQLLHLQNGQGVLGKLSAGDGWLQTTLVSQKDDVQLMNEMYLRTLSRLPQDREIQTVRGLLAMGDNRADVFTDLFWALLNSKEFAFNR